MSIIIDKNLHSQGMDLIILIAAREMMLSKIPKDVIYSIKKKLEAEKEELLKNLD
ncbi:MAG: hypothetical protein NUV47_01115 [Patescibacteria group bacterium]|nr:hypothetical protein [Patescibacteria group bacterium]